jgi:NADH-quinone oxidoreductase subunit F
LKKLSSYLLEIGVDLSSFKSKPTVFFGTQLKRDDEKLYEDILSTQDKLLFAPIEDSGFENFIKYEAGTERGVLALLANAFNELSSKKIEALNSLDEGYISAECNVGEEEALEFAKKQINSKTVWIFGSEWESHKDAKEIALWLKLIKSQIDVEYVIVGVKEQKSTKIDTSLPDMDMELESFDGTVVFGCLSFNEDEESFILASPQFSIAAKAKDGNKVLVKSSFGEYIRFLKIDNNLKGTIALLPVGKLPSGYRYSKSSITLVG